MRRWVLVGGSAGAGKSTLVGVIGEVAPDVRFVRPVDSFFRVAERLGIDRSHAFELAPRHEELILEDTVTRCSGASLVVSDVHYAIQPERDSLIALSGDWRGNSKEAYTASMNPALFQLARQAGVDSVIMTLLWADPQVVLDRLRARDGQRARHAALQDVVEESRAERHFWLKLSGHADVARSFDSNAMTPRALADEILSLGSAC